MPLGVTSPFDLTVGIPPYIGVGKLPMMYILLSVGLGMLLVGGELLVRGAVAIARRLGVSELLIGLTFVGVGTSIPELVTSLDAALVGAPGIALGNVVGSNIANILLILGVGAVIAPLCTTPQAFRRDGPMLVGASVLLLLVCVFDVMVRSVGVAFVALLLTYTWHAYRTERSGSSASAAMHAAEAEAIGQVPGSIGPSLAIALGGLVGITVGASLLVEAAIEIALAWHVSEAVIGLTLVALGTSLPELATAVVAAFRRRADVAIGNIIGSNIFNILGILGVTSLVAPLPIPAPIARFDIWVMLAVAILGSAFAMTSWRVDRREGGVLLLAYVAYLALVIA